MKMLFILATLLLLLLSGIAVAEERHCDCSEGELSFNVAEAGRLMDWNLYSPPTDVSCQGSVVEILMEDYGYKISGKGIQQRIRIEHLSSPMQATRENLWSLMDPTRTNYASGSDKFYTLDNGNYVLEAVTITKEWKPFTTRAVLAFVENGWFYDYLGIDTSRIGGPEMDYNVGNLQDTLNYEKFEYKPNIAHPPLPPSNSNPTPPIQAQTSEDFSDNGHTYRVVSTPAGITWPDAKSQAERMGGHLVTITSRDENEFIRSITEPNDKLWIPESFGSWGPWIGAQRSGNGWSWVTGESPSPDSLGNWAPGEPNSPDEHYVSFIRKSQSEKSTWDDVPDSTKLNGFIVEFDNSQQGGTNLQGSNDGRAGSYLQPQPIDRAVPKHALS